MGTPASVVSEPLPWQAPIEARGRKQASANIFQDADLLQIQGLFQHSGNQLAKKWSLQIIWECTGDHRVVEALRRLHRKRSPRQKPLAHSLHHCIWLRIQSPDLHWPMHRAVPPRQPSVNSTRTPGGQVPGSATTGGSQTPQATFTRSDTDARKGLGMARSSPGILGTLPKAWEVKTEGLR
ncbi:Hypothetical predicted protein [Marmota monax]|uniref:Arginine vasopressin-induced protein 1 n=1 Tax=Marmota monax TaxID=9995 RepID=A0A5E4AET7_MARMO|nr:Hypothetical predicted protein [Marmota monax]